MRPLSAHSGLRGPPLNLCDIMQRGYLPQVPLLVNLGTNLETRDVTGRTPLMLTAYVQPEEWGVGVARLLIEMGVRMSHRDKHGMNALHHACIYERVELVRVLLNALDFDLAQSDKFGNTALHYAAMSGNVELVKLLANYHHRYRISLTKVNKESFTAGDEALRCGGYTCAAILSDPPAPSNGKDDNQSECKSNAPLAAPSETSIVVESEDSKMVVNEEARSVAAHEDDAGGLFPRCDPGSQDEMVRKLLSPHPSPLASDRSTDSKTRSMDSSPRLRRSGVRRPQSAIARPASSGSSNSSRSGASARKQSLLSVRSNNSNAENSVNGTKYGSDAGKPPKAPSIQRRGSVLQDVQITDLNRPAFKAPRSRSLKDLTFIGRSSTSLPQPLPYEKDPERVIHVASDTDFRNTPEYVLKLTRMEFNASHFDTDILPVLVRPSQAAQYEDQASQTKPPGTGSWRENIRFLYRHYEYQCSPSWRNAAIPPPEPTLLSPNFGASSTQGDEVDADSGSMKKVRRPSSSQRPGSQMNDISTSSNTKRRPAPSKQRKTSNASVPYGGRQDKGHGDQGSDNATGPVSESTSASTAVRKKSEGRHDPGSANNGTITRSSCKTSVDNSKGSGSDTSSVVARSNGGASGGSGSGESTADHGRCVGVSNSYTVPAVTETLIADNDDAEAQEMNAEPADIDNSRLTVLSDISED